MSAEFLNLGHTQPDKIYRFARLFDNKCLNIYEYHRIFENERFFPLYTYGVLRQSVLAYKELHL